VAQCDHPPPSPVTFSGQGYPIVSPLALPSDFTFDKIQDGGGRHFEIQFKGYNLVGAALYSQKMWHTD